MNSHDLSKIFVGSDTENSTLVKSRSTGVSCGISSSEDSPSDTGGAWVVGVGTPEGMEAAAGVLIVSYSVDSNFFFFFSFGFTSDSGSGFGGVYYIERISKM